jgi:phosphoribosylanthranilate isomerase
LRDHLPRRCPCVDRSRRRRPGLHLCAQQTADHAREIIGNLPRAVEKIGVFLDAPADEISSTVSTIDLTGIQLHGNQAAIKVYDSLPKKKRESLRIIRTILVNDGIAARLNEELGNPGPVNAWLLDSGAGSGKAFDWASVRAALEDRKMRFVIAGGLRPENVGEAIAIFSPWGVDVVSGIESEPGRKDLEKMRAFVAAVRKAEHP